MDYAIFGFYSIRPQKLEINPTYQPTSGCAEPKGVQGLLRRPMKLFLAEYKNFLPHFLQKNVVRTGKKWEYNFSFPISGENWVNSWKRWKYI